MNPNHVETIEGQRILIDYKVPVKILEPIDDVE